MPRTHVAPPSRVTARAPSRPGAYAVPARPPARTEKYSPVSRAPTAPNFAPASCETTVVPLAPAADTSVSEANEAAKIGSVDAATSDHFSPPSAVRTSRSPFTVVAMHSSRVAQSISSRSRSAIAGFCADQLTPPSSVCSTSCLAPTPNPCSASTNSTSRRARAPVSATSFHATPASVVM